LVAILFVLKIKAILLAEKLKSQLDSLPCIENEDVESIYEAKSLSDEEEEVDMYVVPPRYDQTRSTQHKDTRVPNYYAYFPSSSSKCHNRDGGRD